MSTTLYRRTWFASIPGPARSLQVLVVSVIGFAISRPGMTNLGRSSELFSSIAVVAAFAAAIALRQIRYSDVTSALRITMRWVGVFIFLQVLFDALGPFPGPPNILFGDQGPVLYFRYVAVIGVIAGVAALWRPSFLIPLFLFYVGWRELIGTLSGIPVVDTDYLGLLDVGYFSTLGAFIAIFVTSSWVRGRLPFLWKSFVGQEGGKSTRGLAFGLIWACGVGAHLGSYYHSGRMKMHVGGADPFFWVLHNPTQNSILIGLERGDNPLALWPHLLQALSDGIAWGQPFLNIFVFGLQLLAPLAAVSVSVLSAILPFIRYVSHCCLSHTRRAFLLLDSDELGDCSGGGIAAPERVHLADENRNGPGGLIWSPCFLYQFPRMAGCGQAGQPAVLCGYSRQP